MNKTEHLISQAFANKSVLTKKELTAVLLSHFPNWAEQTISWNIYKLKEEGFLYSVSRGLYSLKPTNIFEPELSSSLKRIHNKVKKEFPFVEFCVWDSRWFNQFMRHQLFQYQLIIEVEKEVLESVFYSISDFSKKAFLNPDAEMFDRYVSNFDEAIIIKPLISEAPISDQNGYRIAPLEKLLVDMLIDRPLFAAQQGELSFIFNRAFEKHFVNQQKMKRYASRRNQREELENYLNKSLA